MPNPLPHWHPDADFVHVPFFIRRMNTSGFIMPGKVPQAVRPGQVQTFLELLFAPGAIDGSLKFYAGSRGNTYLCANFSTWNLLRL